MSLKGAINSAQGVKNFISYSNIKMMAVNVYVIVSLIEFSCLINYNKVTQSDTYANDSLLIVATSNSKTNRSFESVLFNDSVEFKQWVWNVWNCKAQNWNCLLHFDSLRKKRS